MTTFYQTGNLDVQCLAAVPLWSGGAPIAADGEVGGAHGAAVLADDARGVDGARALLLAALGGELGGAHGAAVLLDGARGVEDARVLLLAALGGDVGGAHGAVVLVRWCARGR